MNGHTGFRVVSFATILVLQIAVFQIGDPLRAQAEGLSGPGASCPACGAASGIFADGFEVATTCRWSARFGTAEVCPSTCGDCSVTDGEICDDGNMASETACPYGTTFCTGCSAACDEVLPLVGGYCGDGFTQPEEACDDGNSFTESSCPYGLPFCDICDSSCANQPRTGPVCGDGEVEFPEEICDDGNIAACGGCSQDCRNPQSTQASGLIVVVDANEIVDGETVTVGDGGFHSDGVFEFDKNGSVGSGSVPVAILPGDTAADVAAALTQAINATLLFVNASLAPARSSN